MNLALFILRCPWWVHVAIAGLIVYFGMSMKADVVQAEADLEVALAAEAPEPVPLHLFQPAAHVGTLKEGRVLAQVNADYNYRLINKTNGVTTSETAMYVLFGPDADESAEMVQAVIMVPPREVDAFSDWALDRAVDFGNFSLVYDVHGRFSSSHSKSGLARDALRDEGLTPASNMQFITPYLNGREAGLRKAASRSEGSQMVIYIIAACFGLLGIVKFAFGRAMGGNRGGGRRGGRGGARGGARPMPDPLSPVDTSQRPVPLMAEPGTPETAWASTETREEAVTARKATPPEEAAVSTAGPKATRAAKLLEKQRMLAQAAAADQPKAKPMNVTARLSALEQARSFRKSVSKRPSEAKHFRAKMKEDPFEKLGR